MRRLFQAISKWWMAGEISLRDYLWVGLLVRMPAVWLSRGYDFMDHQFQYVDPAYHLGLGGSWWQPHDYVQGLRSWVYPGLLAGLFRVLAWLGIDGAEPMMIATRFVHALFGLVPLAALWMFVVRWKGWKGQRPLLLFVACNAFVVYSGVQPTGPTFAVGLALTSVLLFHGPGRAWPFVSGLFLGLAFACRFQDAFFGPVLFVAGLVQKRWQATAWFSFGTAIVVTVQGLVDWLTWGSFLHSPFRYVAWNVLEGAARRYGDQPVWFYLPFIVIVLVWIPPFLRSGFTALAKGARRMPVLFACSAFYLFMHHLVARKALRFVITALILLLIVYAAELLTRHHTEPPWRSAHRRVFLGLHLLAFALASIWYPHRGPIEAALELSHRRDFENRLVIVDGDPDALGGHYYLRRRFLDVEVVPRAELFSWIRRTTPETPLYVLVTRAPLEGLVPPADYELEFVGYFTDWPDVKRNTRRYLYRLVRPPP